MLSKSKFTRGNNCHKSLWLYVNKREERELPELVQAVLDRGTDVGKLAQDYFPGGVMAVQEDYPGFESAKRTQELIAGGTQTIYEATFIYDNTLVAVDILTKIDGRWQLFEVKSTNSVKPQHIEDVAVQYYVASGSGLDIADVSVMHMNGKYVRNGALDVKGLFAHESVMEPVQEMLDEVVKNIRILSKVEKLKKEPKVKMGDQCLHPYYCDFYEYCSGQQPVATTPEPELSSKPEIDRKGIEAFLSEIIYPVCFLDFETIMPCVPMFDKSRPYQQLTFQYSLHFLESKNAELVHTYHLAESNLSTDPRPGLIKQMLKETRKAKTVFVYSRQFEETRINEMIRDFPEYAKPLEALKNKILDLIVPFRSKLFRTGTMEGSSSIKKVLPALCPDFSYDNLAISNGMAASNAFMGLYYTDDKELKEKTRKELLEYCHLDTMAMVKILEVLVEYSRLQV